MKPGQWAVAAFVLAVMVFAITFAMNFLGGPRGDPRDPRGGTHDPNLSRSVTFLNPKEAPVASYAVECEANVPHHYDFWFVNDADKDVLVGGYRLGCTSCSSVELFLLPPSAKPHLDLVAGAAEDHTALELLESLGLFSCGLTGGVEPVVLLARSGGSDSVKVPPGRGGWIRVTWKVEKAGMNNIVLTTVWMNDRNLGARHDLQIRPMHMDRLRVKTGLDVRVVTDEQLARGVTYEIDVWSSTRDSLDFQAKPTSVRGGGPAADPFEVGEPRPMSPAELAALERDNNPASKDVDLSNVGFGGRVRCGYKVPVTLHAMSPNKKVPFDVGQFRRGVTLSGPDVGADPKTVIVTGRVRGLVEVGGDDDGIIDFRTFDSRDGAAGVLSLSSEVPDVELTFDRDRTPVWLAAKLENPQSTGGARRTWRLTATVLKNQASGPFPRSGEPLYEDSAVYLTALAKDKEPRSIRIAVRGTANER